MKATYIIPGFNLEKLTKEIEKLNRIAGKLGAPPINFSSKPDHVRYKFSKWNFESNRELVFWIPEYELSDFRLEEKIGSDPADWKETGEVQEWVSVELSGESPSMSGWRFVAILSPVTLENNQTVNLIKSLPGEECPKEFRDRVGACDHCNTSRRRNETFVVRNEDGLHKVVGRQCLKDFLGNHKDPHHLAAWAENLAFLGSLIVRFSGDEDFEGVPRHSRNFDLNYFLTLTACAIRKIGWVSRGTARDNFCVSTADMVLDEIVSARRGSKSDLEPTQKDLVKAEKAIEWAYNLEGDQLENDYLYNCYVVARAGFVNQKTAGIAASLIVAYQKHLDRLEELKNRPESNHIGIVGERIKAIKLSCRKVITMDGAYGVTGLHILNDDLGNDLTWKASGSSEWIREGETVFAAATVKDHGEYKGRKQTKISRVSIISEEKAKLILEKKSKIKK